LWRHADGRVDMVGGDVSGLPLGIDADAGYGQCSIPLEQGDMFMLYTDGLSEALNASDELYGIRRLVQRMAQPAESVRVHSARILEDVRRFTGARAQSDDMCVTAFGRMGR
jgi:sigma-B regulation protein RsbU (phosphoserine phosphatase)